MHIAFLSIIQNKLKQCYFTSAVAKDQWTWTLTIFHQKVKHPHGYRILINKTFFTRYKQILVQTTTRLAFTRLYTLFFPNTNLFEKYVIERFNDIWLKVVQVPDLKTIIITQILQPDKNPIMFRDIVKFLY